MWIKVRTIDGKITKHVDVLSKKSLIENVRKNIEEQFDVPPHRQRLFFRGKQLEDGHSLFDYDVGINEMIQLMVKHEVVDEPKDNAESKDKDAAKEQKKEEEEEEPDVSSDKENQEPMETCTQDSGIDDCSTYRIGDVIDCRDTSMGAWFEARITKIERKTEAAWSELQRNDPSKIDDGVSTDDGFIYHVIYERYEKDPPVQMPVQNLRPRAYRKLALSDVKIKDKVLVNYNFDEPTERGYWYDGFVTAKPGRRLVCSLYCGKSLVPVNDCRILFTKEIFDIEVAGTQINVDNPVRGVPDMRQNKPNCDTCKDDPKRNCKHCGCHVCSKKSDGNLTLLCDECDTPFHIYCLNPPLTSVPDDDEWFCPLCKNDSSEVVMAGQKLKASKKKQNSASAKTTSTRDWGRGMACVGRSKECSIVPSNHRGPIPGVEVGRTWKFRLQVSENGVHRPHVAGIHGRGEDGAYSIVLSGGYEDDQDDGDEFTYTGAGGRDLSGNKRTAEQSCDQTLTRTNLALAKNCNAKIDTKNGATATNWQAGKPLRVVRNAKGRKHSNYAPEEGNRYDGIYKVVKYWPEKGKSGFLVWRYLMRRDDPTPAPWTKEGQERMEKLGLTIEYPEGYLEAQAQKEQTEKKGKRKRKDDDDEEEDSPEEGEAPAKKKVVIPKYELDKSVQDLVKKDTVNAKLWDDAAKHQNEGAKAYLAFVEEAFSCLCCQDVVYKPITTDCQHNVCKSCLQRSFKAEVYSCPACRADLGADNPMKINEILSKILLSLFPGYAGGRS